MRNLKCREFNSPLRKMIFFFVQINYFKLSLYACILYNDKKQPKVLSNLSKITLNFWTVCFDLLLFLEKKNSASCPLKSSWSKVQIFISHWQCTELFYPPKNRQMKAAQNNKYEVKKTWDLALVCSLLTDFFFKTFFRWW